MDLVEVLENTCDVRDKGSELLCYQLSLGATVPPCVALIVMVIFLKCTLFWHRCRVKMLESLLDAFVICFQ